MCHIVSKMLVVVININFAFSFKNMWKKKKPRKILCTSSCEKLSFYTNTCAAAIGLYITMAFE